jgi:aminopeptidase N
VFSSSEKKQYFCQLINTDYFMKQYLPLVFLLLMFSGFTNAQDIIPGAETMNIARMKAETWDKALQREINYDIGNNYDLKYYRFFWNINPSQNYISGNVTSHFIVTVANTQTIQFELANSLTVDSIKYHGGHAPFTHLSKTISIQLPSPLGINTLDSVTIWYSGIPGNSGGFGSFTTSTHNGVPVMWTLSEPYGSSDWWPCKNVLSDKIDSIDVFVRTPDQYRAASNGLLAGEQHEGNHVIYHWKHRYPIETYLVAIAVTNYSVYSDYATLSTGLLEILNYVYPENVTSAMANTPKVIPSLELFDSLFGPYPFYLEKYGHAQFGWGGGMEHQTMSFMGSFGHELIAHELAHMWYGDAVTCGSWQDIWLNEGFATYLTGLTYENFFDGVYWMPWKTQVLTNITSEPGGSVWCDDTTNTWRIFSGRLSYNKGAYLLHMLRWVIGDEDFFQTLKNYALDPNLRYGYARTSDFIAHAEALYGQNLDWFFDQWFTGQGFPSYTIHGMKYPNNEVHVNISQTQSHPSVTFFKMPVPVRFSRNIQDTLIVFDHQYNDQEFIIHLDFDPLQISFDPELWILSNYNTTSLNIEDYTNLPLITVSPNPVTEEVYIQSRNKKISRIAVFDQQGKKLHETVFPETEHFTFDIGSLPGGIYIIRISGTDVNYNTKLIRY